MGGSGSAPARPGQMVSNFQNCSDLKWGIRKGKQPCLLANPKRRISLRSSDLQRLWALEQQDGVATAGVGNSNVGTSRGVTVRGRYTLEERQVPSAP